MADEVVTLTANPSLDRTLGLDGPLTVGQVQRTSGVAEQAGGKGLNVARVVISAGHSVTAVVPEVDELYRKLAGLRPAVPLLADDLAPGRRVRVNTAVTEPDGTTTKINESGHPLDEAALLRARKRLLEAAEGAAWVVLSGSLPPGAPVDWYAELSAAVAERGCRVAVDTSGRYLSAVVDALPASRIDVLKPNADELAELAGGDAAAFEASAADGDVSEIAAAAGRLVEAGVGNVLVTLGGSGAVLVNADGAWYAPSPKIAVRSTVGAGDSALAGFILADLEQAGPEGCLASAISYGSAAAALPSTTLPTPRDAAGLATEVVSVERPTVSINR